MTLTDTATPQPWRRNRKTAILLAVFLGAWTWVYTYRRDAWKATLGLAIQYLTVLITVLIWIWFRDNLFIFTAVEDTFKNAVLLPAIGIFAGVQIWAIVDASRPKAWELASPDGAFSTTSWKRNKITATLLAVFLGPWTWVYTHRKDAGKAAVGLGVGLSMLVTLLVLGLARTRALADAPPGQLNEGYEIIGGFLNLLFSWFGAWIWAMVDVSLKPFQWYHSGNQVVKSKKSAVLLAVFLGAWTWFYTYRKDAWKFWIGIAIVYGGFLSMSIFGLPGVLFGFLTVSAIFLWIASIINASVRKQVWYQTYGRSPKSETVY